MSAFEEWYNGIVGFHINSERIIDDFNSTLYNKFDYAEISIDPDVLRKWMVVCWNNAIETVNNLTLSEDYWDHDGLVSYELLPAIDALKEKS